MTTLTSWFDSSFNKTACFRVKDLDIRLKEYERNQSG